jgi:hypothetical protein
MVCAAEPREFRFPMPDPRLKDARWNLEQRRIAYERGATDPRFAAAMRQRCKDDVLFFINVFIWTYDPRRDPYSKLPMITYYFQDETVLELVEAVMRGEDIIVEKSRDMGASWICLLVFLWLFMFYPLKSFLIGSRVENYVDKQGNPKALFWKLDFALEHMPAWLRPNIMRLKLHVRNLDNGSVIDGESTTDEFSRGDRRTAILLDEFAAVPNGHRILSASRDATKCRIFNSTHLGTGTAYYELTRGTIRKLRLHWSEHEQKNIGAYTRKGDEFIYLDRKYWRGRKGRREECLKYDDIIAKRGVPTPDGMTRSPWFAVQCERAAHAVEIAQELEIDCLGSSFQFFSAISIQEHIDRHACAPFRVGEVEYDALTLQPKRWRDDKHGRFRLWMLLDANGMPLTKSEKSLGADISAGTGSSNSALSAIDTLTNEKVLEFASPYVRPEEFGKLSVVVARWLGEAFMIWEQSGPGRQYGDIVVEAGYGNIYFRRDEEKVVPKMTNIPGWVPTKDNKLAVIGEYRRALEMQTCVNRSEIALSDCLEYIFTAGGTVEHSRAANSIDPSGAKKNHGDRMIADALAWKGCKSRRPSVTVAKPVTPSNSYGGRQSRFRTTQTSRKNAWSKR